MAAGEYGKGRTAKRVKRGALAVMTRPQAVGDPEDANTREQADLARSVGWEIRSLRMSLGLSATDLAAAAGISNGMISKIERGQTTPSFGSVISIAKALNVPVARLFVGHEKRADMSFVRSGRGIEVRRHGAKKGFRYELLGHLLSGERFIEPYLVEISPDAAPNPGFQHTGIEFMYVLEGRMSFRYAETVVSLGPGDTLVFDSNAIHGHEKIDAGPVRYLSVVFNIRA